MIILFVEAVDFKMLGGNVLFFIFCKFFLNFLGLVMCISHLINSLRWNTSIFNADHAVQLNIKRHIKRPSLSAWVEKPPPSPRTLPAFDLPVKKLPVTSSRLGSIFDFHCSLTKPPGMLLFKHATSSPLTTAAANGGRKKKSLPTL